jgi:carbamoyl-phosphate synthase small subunit
VKKLLPELPTLGICLGHQIIALAAGAKTYKMKFGHRGINHPVKDLETGKVYITTQNHGYAVDESSLHGTGFKVTKANANDGTVEGITHEELPIISVQYHPEASPGPLDSKYLFDEFMKLMER